MATTMNTYSIGQTVLIEPRTFPGSNKPGGTARITHIHTDNNTNQPTKVDVKYVLGGKEANVEMTYVSLPKEETPRRGARERRSDVKMNIGEEKKKKTKRSALKDIDGNSKKQKVKGGGVLPKGCVMEGEWMFIKSGKLSDYTPFFSKGTTVQFWWDDEKGWMHAAILKDITRSLSRGIIRWIVKMKFEEDGEVFSYAFHPKDGRWKVKIEKDVVRADEGEACEDEIKKVAKKKRNKASKQDSTATKSKEQAKTNNNKKASFTIAEDSDSDDDILLSDLNNPPKKFAPKKAEEVKKLPSVAPAKNAAARKVSEIKFKPIYLGLIDKKDSEPSRSSGDCETKTSQPAKANTSGGDVIFVNKPKPSCTSFQSSRHHSVAAASSTAATSKLLASKKNETIPARQFHKATAKKSNPFEFTHIPSSKSNFSSNVKDAFKKVSSQVIQRSKDQNAAAMPMKAVPKTTGAMNVMTGLHRPTQMTEPGAAKHRPKTQMEKQYKRDSEKANLFMLGITDKKLEEEDAKKPFCTTSPEPLSGPDRKSIFRSGLAEVFFKPDLGCIEVDTFMEKLNKHTVFRGLERFTLPEIMAFLTEFDKEGKITMSWKDGRMGTIYDCS